MPRRDLWLLPLIALLTVFVMLACAEGAARVAWPERETDSCMKADPVLGQRYLPDCVSVMKAVEGPWYENRYNGCGYRSEASCGPAPAGVRRVALLGSSISQGYLVRYDDTIARRLEVDLSAACGAPVEVQNLGAPGYFGHVLEARMDEALKLRPDEVLLVMLPFDLEGLASGGGATSGARTEPMQPGPMQPGPMQPGRTLSLHRVFESLKLSRALIVAQHFLFRDPSIYLPLYLRYGDKADFLRPPFSAPWRDRLAALDGLLADLKGRAQRAGVGFMVAFVPQEAQVALMAGRAIPPGIDPGALPAAIGAIARQDGVAFLDSSTLLRREPAPERLYYQVDGHLAGPGQRLAAEAMAHGLAGMPGPFAACRPAAAETRG